MTVYSRRQMVCLLAAIGIDPLLHSAQSESAKSADYEDEEAYRVYSTLIPQDWIGQEAKAESLVIAAQAVSSEMCLKPEGNSANLLAAAIENYKDLTKHSWRLQPRFALARPYVLLSKEELDVYFSKGGSGWKGFYASYPKSGGYLLLSPVGFNSAKNIAIVQVNHWCGGHCGGGGFSVLQKKTGAWEPLPWGGSFCAWAS